MLTDAQETALRTAFRPHAPIEDANSFVGRQDQLRRVREALVSPGLHVVLYGERGSGKTSLANVATATTTRLQVFCEESATFATLLRDAALKYQAANPNVVTFDALRDAIVVGGVTLPASSLTGNMFLQLVSRTSPLCVVFDELDRVKDKSIVASLAELTKNAATYQPDLTFVMVGANDTAEGLLAGHISNFRNLRQVALTRMTGAELREILERGQRVLNLVFEPEVVAEMVTMSDQMPYYLHLLATSAARAALERGSATVQKPDLLAGALAAAQDVDHTLRETYEHAVLSEKGSHIYRRLIWAMASMDGPAFNLGLINERANELALQEGERDVSPQALGAALKRLLSPDKRSIVSQAMTGVYKFSHPLMKGFVRLVRYSQ